MRLSSFVLYVCKVIKARFTFVDTIIQNFREFGTVSEYIELEFRRALLFYTSVTNLRC